MTTTTTTTITALQPFPCNVEQVKEESKVINAKDSTFIFKFKESDIQVKMLKKEIHLPFSILSQLRELE